ncbi:hypothetical protein T484DRAFT_1842949 [Baffinella frigidus]|nr:hypothetical protein T484DRAFT_1842949 [Cryptophyta sp. CCMP2293]
MRIVTADETGLLKARPLPNHLSRPAGSIFLSPSPTAALGTRWNGCSMEDEKAVVKLGVPVCSVEDEKAVVKLGVPVCSVEDEKAVVKLGEQAKEKIIDSICWAGSNLESNGGGRRVLSGRRDGVVQLWDIDAKCELASFDPISDAHAAPKSIMLLGEAGGDRNSFLTPLCGSDAHSALKSIMFLGEAGGDSNSFLTCCENGTES